MTSATLSIYALFVHFGLFLSCIDFSPCISSIVG